METKITEEDVHTKKLMVEIAENIREKIRELKEKKQKQDAWCEEQIEEIFKTAFGKDQYQAILQAPLETPPRWPSLYKEDGEPNVEGLKEWIISEFEQLEKEMKEENRNMEKFVEKVDRQCEELKEDMARRGEQLTREINKITKCHQRTEAVMNEKIRKFKEDLLAVNRPAEELLLQITESTKKLNEESFDRYLKREREIEAMEEAIESETYEMKIEESYKSGLVPKWTHPSLSKVRYTVTPVYRTITEFEEKKRNNEEIITEPFYTSHGGYKMRLLFYPNGSRYFKGSHLSVYIYLMKGDNDNVLTFPFTGNAIIEALNWSEDNGHVERIIQFDESVQLDIRQRVIDGEMAEYGRGALNFLPHLELQQYLHNDMMCLRVSFEDVNHSGSPVPRWHNSEINSSILPCTVTMYQYSQFKKTNSEWYSRPFYTSQKGYKLQLAVNANGRGSGKGTHVSVYVVLMKGEYDEQLQWPFNASITLQLLNWSRDSDHVENTVPHYKAPIECRTRVIEGVRAPGSAGIFNFIPHSVLSNDNTSDIKYINEDKLCFRVLGIDFIL